LFELVSFHPHSPAGGYSFFRPFAYHLLFKVAINLFIIQRITHSPLCSELLFTFYYLGPAEKRDLYLKINHKDQKGFF